MNTSSSRRIVWVAGCCLLMVVSCLHFNYVLHHGLIISMFAVVLSDALIIAGAIWRKEWAWHLAILSALHLALREPLYNYAFALPFAAPYFISGALILSMWRCRHDFNIYQWRWTEAIVSFSLAFCLLLVGGYYFPRINLDYAYPMPVVVQIIHSNDLEAPGLLLFLYVCGLMIHGLAIARRWVRGRTANRR